MSRLTEHQVDQIRAAIDMDDLLEHYGSSIDNTGRPDGKALCIFHDESTPSLSVEREKKLIHCFGCEVEGDAFEVVMAKEQLGWRDAADWLADRYRVDTGADDSPAADPLPPLAAEWTEEALARLHELRGWTPEAIRRLGLRIEHGRVAIPLTDAAGQQVGVTRYQPNPARLGPKEPKMMAAKGTPRGLFPAPERVTGDPLWIVEGEPDAITATSIGLPAVAVPGAQGWDSDWAARFRDRRVVVCCDCDQVGRKLARQVADDLQGAAREVRLVDLDPKRTDGYDLSDALRERQGDHGELRGHLRRLAEKAEIVKPADPAAHFGAQRLSEWQEIMLRRVLRQEPPEAAPIPLPFAELNEAMDGGFRPGQVITLAGYSGHGKSLVADMLLDTATEHGRTGHLYMTEMSLADRGDRYLARNSGVPFSEYRALWRKDLSPGHLQAAEDAIKGMRWPATLISGWNAERICEDILRCGWGIAVVDHIHDLRYRDQSELNDAVHLFAETARESTRNGPGTVVVLLSQLNRDQMSGGRDNRRPKPAMHVLKGTGAIQEVSDEVIFAWLEDDAEGVATDEGAVWTAKGRNNGTGSVAVELNVDSMKLEPQNAWTANGGFAHDPDRDQEAA